jgi:hypothetical protein
MLHKDDLRKVFTTRQLQQTRPLFPRYHLVTRHMAQFHSSSLWYQATYNDEGIVYYLVIPTGPSRLHDTGHPAGRHVKRGIHLLYFAAYKLFHYIKSPE